MADATLSPTPTPSGAPPSQAPHPATVASSQNQSATFSYVLGWITGIYFLMTEKSNAYIRFHAAQSTVVFGALSVTSIVLGILLNTAGMYSVLSLLNSLLSLAAIGLWIFLMMKAYHGEHYKLPIAGDYAERLAAGHPLLAASTVAPHATATPAAPLTPTTPAAPSATTPPPPAPNPPAAL